MRRLTDRLVLLALIGVTASVVRMNAAAAQTPDPATSGPRFLMASATSTSPSRTVPLDVSRTAVLLRRITLNLDSVPLKEALATIGRQAGLNLAYTEDVVPLQNRIRLRADGITVAAALTDVLAAANVDIVFMSSRRAVLRRRAGAMALQTGTVVGRITDGKTSGSLIGVDVFLEGTRWRTATDTGGWYRLADVDTGTHTLTVRRFGYAKRSRRVVVREARVDTVDVALEPVAVALNELVTTATGQQRRRDIGNAITTIHADSVLQAAPIRNLTDLLDNRVPGLSIQHTTGAPGDPARLRLRGIGSVLRGNDPVFIVDGVRVYSDQSEQRSGNLTSIGKLPSSQAASPFRQVATAPAPSPLDQIDPNTIEKIEVFKGPSAATLYGADAANGVIVVTTKKGRPGPTTWNASVTHGRNRIPGRWPEGYFRWGRSLSYGGAPKICTVYDFTCQVDSLVRYQLLNDPELTMLGRGNHTELSLTASGGTQALTYSVAGRYRDEVGLMQLPTFEVERFREAFSREAPDWMRRPHHLKQWSIMSNMTARLGSTADVTLSAAISRTEQQRSTLENSIPSATLWYVDKVSGRYYVPSIPGGSNNEILSGYYTRMTAASMGVTTGLTSTWRPSSWFTAVGRAGLNLIPRDDQQLFPAGLLSALDSGAIIRGTGLSLMTNFDFQATVRKRLGWGFSFETSVGANTTTRRVDDLVSSASGLVAGTTTITGARFVTSEERRQNTSTFGWYIEPRITGERLSLSTGIRLDGGSSHGARLTKSGGLGSLLSLPKLNGTWTISEESWFPFRSLFSSLRLRGAYGQAQVQPGPTDRLRTYTGLSDQQLFLTTLGNTKLRPERSVEIEGGFDADMFDGLLSLELTGYRKTQIDALMPAHVPMSVNGGGTIIQNIGNIRNSGAEITVGITPVRTPGFTWNAELRYARNDNVLVKLGTGVAPNPAQGLVEGYPVASRWAPPILGYADQDNNGIITLPEVQLGDTLVFLGRLLPAQESGLSTNLVLFGGAVGITADFSYESGATQINRSLTGSLIRASGDPSTPLAEQAAMVARSLTEYGLTQDVSTFRFHAVSVNYRASRRVARLFRAQDLTIGIAGSNLGVFSSYVGKDPDVNAWGAGETIVDTGQLPQPRIWQLAVRLRY